MYIASASPAHRGKSDGSVQLDLEFGRYDLSKIYFLSQARRCTTVAKEVTQDLEYLPSLLI